MKWLFVISLFFVVDSAEGADRRPFELGGGVNYSSRPGANNYNIGTYLKVPLSERWQLKLADDALRNTADAHQLSVGADYNFSSDWSSSFFVGGGGGAHLNRPREAEMPKAAWFGYVEAGKRFALVHSLGISYAPQVQVNWVSGGEVDLKIMPANFTWMF